MTCEKGTLLLLSLEGEATTELETELELELKVEFETELETEDKDIFIASGEEGSELQGEEIRGENGNGIDRGDKWTIGKAVGEAGFEKGKAFSTASSKAICKADFTGVWGTGIVSWDVTGGWGWGIGCKIKIK